MLIEVSALLLLPFTFLLLPSCLSMRRGGLTLGNDFRVPIKKSLRHRRNVAVLRIGLIIHPSHLLLRDGSCQPLADLSQLWMLIEHWRAQYRHGHIRRKVMTVVREHEQ